MRFRELYPGVKPKKTQEYCKKAIDEFSSDFSDCDRDDKKTNRHKTVDKNMYDRMSTPIQDFDVHNRNNR